jgi:hypothetical protein
VLAHRPAPVQAKYMGYPGTSGSGFIDYIIADDVVVPPDQHRFFSEKIAALPDTLWVTDTKRAVGAHTKPQRSRPAGKRLCFLLLQSQLEDNAAGIRHLDAAAARDTGQRAVAAGRQCQHSRQPLQRSRPRAASRPSA